MSNSEASKSHWLESIAPTSILVGLALIAFSLFWPMLSNGSSAWSNDQAADYQAASAELHRLSTQIGNTPAENQSLVLREQLKEAESQYATLRLQLDSARVRPARVALILRYTGVALAIAGLFAAVKNSGNSG